jgi:large subunit ribosomal protein L1
MGEDEVFDAVKKGEIEFDRCICHSSSFANMNKAGLGRFLGPKGLMPSAKLGTVVDNVGVTVKNMRGGLIYREKAGVIRMPVGQLGFSPDQLRTNVSTLIEQVKKDALALNDQVAKGIAEVVGSCHEGAPAYRLQGSS